jgi:hypothetical protein
MVYNSNLLLVLLLTLDQRRYHGRWTEDRRSARTGLVKGHGPEDGQARSAGVEDAPRQPLDGRRASAHAAHRPVVTLPVSLTGRGYSFI